MFYAPAVLIAILASSANAFSMPKAPQRMTSLKMVDPWFPDAVTSNTVGIDALG